MWTQYDATKLKPPVKYSCQKKKKIKPKGKHSRIYQFKGTEKHVK